MGEHSLSTPAAELNESRDWHAPFSTGGSHQFPHSPCSVVRSCGEQSIHTTRAAARMEDERIGPLPSLTHAG